MNYVLPKLEDTNYKLLPFDNKFVTYVLKEYLFANKSAIDIDSTYYNDNYDNTGILSATILKYFGLIANNGNFNNKGLYLNQDIDLVARYLLNQGGNYRRIGKYLIGNYEEDVIDLFREYYLLNIDNIDSTNAIDEQLWKQFLEKFPIDKLKTLSLYDYALGQDNNNSYCYLIEYGKYSDIGPTCSNDPNGAKHWGIYFSQKENCYINGSNEKIAEPDSYWNDFRSQLYTFLNNFQNDSNQFANEFPMLKNMHKTLPKLCFMYYPTKFLNIITKSNLVKIYETFGLRYDDADTADSLSYHLNKYLRENIPEISKNKPEYLGILLWDFMENVAKVNEEKLINEESRVTGGNNEIFYGAPGCGKSYKVTRECNDNDLEIIRTTFYPDYTNGEFVGQIIPKADKNGTISYVIQPGPFTEALFQAYTNPQKKICLVIEEINRGNASAIFGDIFQLLDRNEEGKSVFEIRNDIISQYFSNNNYVFDKIIIPANLWIKATMNTSDQNVYTLDTAFKRRWKMIKITNKFDDNNSYDNKIRHMLIPGSNNVTWEEFITKINDEIFKRNSYGINAEDKQIGKYFIKESDLIAEENKNNPELVNKAKKTFAEKVLMYLWEDVTNLNHEIWFDPEYRTLDDLLLGFEKNNLQVFNNIFEENNGLENDE